MVLNCGMFILTLVGVILFAISFQSVPENHVAIRQHKFNKKLIDNELYGSGRFLIGLVHKLRIYPLAYQQIRFSNDSNNAPISSITKDSAKIQISVTLYYTYMPEQLVSLYGLWPDRGRHEQDLAKIAKDIIAQTVNQKTISEFLGSRNEISADVAKKISLEYSVKMFTNLNVFLIDGIVLEATQEERLVRTLISEQLELTERNKNEIRKTEDEIKKLENEINSEIAAAIKIAQESGAELKSKQLLAADKAKFETYKDALATLRGKYGDVSKFKDALQLMDVFMNKEGSIVWNDDIFDN